jgi:hypothetical protein
MTCTGMWTAVSGRLVTAAATKKLCRRSRRAEKSALVACFQILIKKSRPAVPGDRWQGRACWADAASRQKSRSCASRLRMSWPLIGISMGLGVGWVDADVVQPADARQPP